MHAAWLYMDNERPALHRRRAAQRSGVRCKRVLGGPYLIYSIHNQRETDAI